MPAVRALIAVLAVAVLMLMPAGPVQAQNPPPAARQSPAASAVLADVTNRAERSLAQLRQQIDQARTKLQSLTIAPKDLDQVRRDLEQARIKTLEEQSRLAGPLADLKQQLNRLGTAPEKGEPEAADVTAERQRLNDAVAGLEGLSKQIGVVAVDAEQVSSRAAEMQRSAFVEQIFEPSRSALNLLVWVDLMKSLPTLGDRLGGLIQRWKSYPGKDGGLAGRTSFLLVVATVLFAIAALAILLSSLGPKLRDLGKPGRLSRLGRAMAMFASAALITVGLFLAVLTILGSAADDLPAVYRIMSEGVAPGFAAFAGLTTLLYALLAPGSPQWRLVRVADPYAGAVAFLGMLAAVVYGVDLAMANIADTLFLPFEFTIGWNMAVATGLLVLIGLILVNLRFGGEEFDAAPLEEGRDYYLRWVRRLYPLFWTVVLVCVAAMAFGYVSFGHFLARQMLSTGALVFWLLLFHRFADVLLSSALQPESGFGRFLRHTVSLGDTAIARLGLLASTFIDLTVVLVGVPLVLGQWALTWVDFKSVIVTAFFGFKLGEIVISPSSILLAIAVLLTGLVIVRLFTAWLDQRVLARTQMDSGVRNSVSTGARYAAILIAASIAVTAAGLDFSNLALVFGALGVGVGFGLQSIVNNFVSGLILLAERPIKVGDWIQVTGGEGIVKRINVRSTEIETFDKCSVIVPNSSLISETVSNWYHNDIMGRVRVPVGVSYASDPEQVKQILLDCASKHERALAFPQPFVLFLGFGNSSLDFELRVYIDDVAWVGWVGSDLRFAILREFRAAGIEIPFPQQDVHLRDIDRIETAMGPHDKPPARRRARKA